MTMEYEEYEECPDCKGSMRLKGHTDHYDDDDDPGSSVKGGPHE